MSEQPPLGEGLGLNLHTCGCAPEQVQPRDFRGRAQARTSSVCPDSPCWHWLTWMLSLPGSPVPLLQVDADKDRSLLLDWDRVRVFDREIAQMFLNMTKLEKEAQVGCSTHISPICLGGASEDSADLGLYLSLPFWNTDTF